MSCTPSNPGMQTPCPTCPPGDPGRGIDRVEPVPGAPGVYNVIGTDGALLGTVTFPPAPTPDPGTDGVGIDRVEQLSSGVVMVYGTNGAVLGSFVPPAGKDADPCKPCDPGPQGPGFVDAVIDSEGHLILTTNTGTTVDAGLIPVPHLTGGVVVEGLQVCIGVGCAKECVTFTWKEICDGLTEYGCFTAPPAPVAPTVTTPPVIESTETVGGTITVTTPAVFAGTPTPTVVCSWTLNGAPVPSETSCSQVTNAAEGTWVLTATATNSAGTVSAQSNTCVVSPVAPPAPCPTPMVVAFLSPNVYQVGQPYVGSISMQDTTSVTAVNGLPPGLTAGAFAAGEIPVSGTPTTEGSFSVTVNATNNCGGGLTATSVSNVPAGYGDVIPAGATPCPAPTVAAVMSPTAVQVGVPYTGTIEMANTTAVNAVNGLPAGITAGALSGTTIPLSGTPTTEGAFTVTVDATNACGGGMTTTNATALPAGSGTVQPAAVPCPTPTISATVSPTEFRVGEAYAGQIMVANATAVTAVNGLPAGITAGAFSGGAIPLSGTPTVEGAFTITVDATNACGGGMTTTSATGLAAGSGTVLPAFTNSFDLSSYGGSVNGVCGCQILGHTFTANGTATVPTFVMLANAVGSSTTSCPDGSDPGGPIQPTVSPAPGTVLTNGQTFSVSTSVHFIGDGVNNGPYPCVVEVGGVPYTFQLTSNCPVGSGG